MVKKTQFVEYIIREIEGPKSKKTLAGTEGLQPDGLG